MCGITGIFGMGDKKLIKKMTSVIAHRGPDSDGHYVDENISLGMRRLSIIDLSTGDQPIFNEKEDKLIIFNGEVYNYRELRTELKKQGCGFRTNSDTEVVLQAYEKWGNEGISRLNGMFAFAIYDKKKKELVLARDRVGIKPLYYTLADEKLIFGSEIKCILEYNGIKRKVDREALSSYLTYGTVLGDKTLFAGIKKLLPGNILIYNGTTRKTERIDQPWQIETNDYSPDFLLKILQSTVKNQMISDVPLGAFLSGGIDSSTIVGLMSKVSDKPIETFTVGFGQESDELKYAKTVSEHFGTNHHEITVSPEDIPKTIDKLVWHYDDLNWDSASLPVYMVSTLARKYVKVVLTGEGSDELFAGYERYKPFSPAFPIPNSIRWNIYEKFVTMFDDTTRKKISGFNSSYANEVLNGYRNASGASLNNVIDFEFNELLPNQLLNKADKATMAASIEGRVPFLDNDILAFAKKVPLTMKLNWLEGKYILRQSVKDLLPRITKKRMKKGFGAKPVFWLRNKNFRDIAAQYLEESLLKKDGIDYSMCKDMLENFEKPKRAYQLWALILLEMWYEKFEVE